MINFDSLYQDIHHSPLEEWLPTLPQLIDTALQQRQHGKRQLWLNILEQLPPLTATHIDLAQGCLHIGQSSDIDLETQQQLRDFLKQLIPWRKGPYKLFDIHIDTEWRSDFKWQRLHKHITPLKNRYILDIGCGNGYHMWRMHSEGAKCVIGADPSQFFLTQFQIMKHYIDANSPVHLLPLKSEELPTFVKRGFDSVFSMGVLYHRRSPLDHLNELKHFLCQGGELILETLIVDGDEQTALIPQDRYAKMRNVWFLPSTAMLVRWLERIGFINIRVVDVTVTSLCEQRVTPWMQFESLQDFLDPNDLSLSCEGHPAPKRAIIICNRK
jgi:tRNA (mo5U34)-methyltransferase